MKPIKCLVHDDNNVRYDLILGRQACTEMGLKIDFDEEKVTWVDRTIPFHDKDWGKNKANIKRVLDVGPSEVAKKAESHAVEIKPAQYAKADLDEVIVAQTHLTDEQKRQLREVFEEHKELFNGKVGRYPKEFHIDVDPNAEPFYQMRPYPIDHRNMETLKGELDRQEELGIIEKCNEATRWCLPMFAIPKRKDGTIRTVHDFRRLNAVIQRKKYPLPTIEEIMWKMKPYKFLTKIDISMQYYAFYLDEESTWYCVFITPFGKYRLKVLAMGMCQSSDWAQSAMEEVFRDILHHICIYMDDIKFEDMDWDKHLEWIREVLRRLLLAGFTVNPAKCEWGVKETDFLG